MKRAILALVLALAGAAQAGQSCNMQPPEVHSVQRSMELAERTARALDASGARVVVLARAGQDLSRWGQRWSHLGWAYRDESGARPAWRVVHKLNACGTATGALFRQGLGEFFLDDLFEPVAAYAVPLPSVQAALLPVLQDNARVAQLHHGPYSMVAYPWSRRYQQSNQWAIETLAMAMEPGATDRARAQAWLQLKDYRPSVLQVDAMTRLGARVGTANVAFDDHPTQQRFADRIATVTVDSVFAWLERAGMAGAVKIVR
jgi:hypothetical protein